MPAAQPISLSSSITQNLAVAFLMTLMWSLISLDGNPQQESFNRGGIYLNAATALAYILLVLLLAGRPLTPRRAWFIRQGGMCLMLVGMVIYILVASLLFKRVL